MIVTYEIGNRKLLINFPQELTSSNVRNFKETIFKELDPIKRIGQVLSFHLMFEKTVMIDSLGLNLILSLIEWAEDMELTPQAHIQHDSIFKILDAVWLTRKMSVHRLT